MNTNNEALFMGLSLGEWAIVFVGAIVSAVVGGVLPILYSHIMRKSDKKENSLKLALNDDKGRYKIIAELENDSRLASFQRHLGQWNDWLNGFFGQSVWRRQAFMRCLQIAFFYPIVLFFLAWTLGGSGSLSGIPLLPDGYEWWQRLLLLVALLGWVIICYRYFKNFVKISTWFGEILRKKLNFKSTRLSESMLSSLVDLLVVTVVVTVIGAGAVTVGVAGAFAFAVAVAFAVTVTVTGAAGAVVAVVAVAITVIIAVAVTDAVTVIIAVTDAVAGDSINTAVFFTWVLFFVILPFTNALMDYGSWAVSRLFLRKMVDSKRIWSIGIELAFDLLCAAGFLFGLAMLIPITIELGNLLFVSFDLPLIDWRAMLAQMTDGPWQGWIVLGGFLATTLLPTFIHLAVGVYGIASLNPVRNNQLAEKIKPKTTWSEYEIDEMTNQIMATPNKKTGLIAAGAVILALGAGSFYLAEHFGQYLLKAAIWSASLI